MRKAGLTKGPKEMHLSELNDRGAVLAAIHEFDQLGREAFLEKHGFGPARSYFLLHEGRIYDSKAIAGVALGIQFPEHGTLEATEFSGGRDTVQRVLERLDFVVIDGVDRTPPSGIWAFCANPSRYRIRDAVENLELDRWSVPRGDVREGDRVLIWQTTDSQGRRGVVGVGQILSDPIEMPDLENPYWSDPSDGALLQRRVEVRYLPAAGLPRWIDDADVGEILGDLSVAKARGGTVFKVTGEQWARLQPFFQLESPTFEELEAEERLRYRTRPRRGQGFGLSPADRRIIESYAMERAIAYLEQHWDRVTDVSGSSSFDLHCEGKGKELRVEVKGTTTVGDKIILTRNEVEESRRSEYALFLVSEIALGRDETGNVVARGGTCRYFSSWTATDPNLMPISYRCAVDHAEGMIVH